MKVAIKNGRGKKRNWCLGLIQSPNRRRLATEAQHPVKAVVSLCNTLDMTALLAYHVICMYCI